MVTRYLEAPGVIVHRVSKEDALAETVMMGRVRVSSAGRTLMELGACVDEESVEVALDDALRRRLTSYARIARCLDRLGGRGRRGSQTLRHLLEVRDVNNKPTGSARETKLLRVLRKGRLPTPVTQHALYRHDGSYIRRVDFAYLDVSLAIESDSYEFHSGRLALERDAVVANELAAIGWRLLRITSNMVEADADGVVALVRRARQEQIR